MAAVEVIAGREPLRPTAAFGVCNPLCAPNDRAADLHWHALARFCPNPRARTGIR